MEFVTILGTSTTATFFMVAIVKFARPAVSSTMVACSAVVSGVGLSFLVALSKGMALDRSNIATCVLAGIFAAASAMGIRQVDNAADKLRVSEGSEGKEKRA